jgi:hypothetical protein
MRSFFVLVAILLAVHSPLVKGDPVKRDVIAFWDSSETEEDEYTFSSLHRHLEFIFNHYGLRLTYVDTNRPLPQWLFQKDALKKILGCRLLVY